MSNDGLGPKAGLIGCGAIAWSHARALERIGIPLAAVCDADRERASAFAAAFGARVVGSVEDASRAGATVVHVTTPPDSHLELARRALEVGCHVFVEKPLGTDAEEARHVLELAQSRGLRVGVDHSLLFDPRVVALREDVRRGALGHVTGLEVLRASRYERCARLDAGRPGDAFRDLGPHALYLASEFLGPLEHVTAEWQRLGGEPRLAYDEWTALVRCANGVAHVRLSWNERPLRSELVVHGTRGSVRLDLLAMSSARRPALGLPAAPARALCLLSESAGPLRDLAKTCVRAVTLGLRPFEGVEAAVASFYESLHTREPFLVSAEQALDVVQWTEQVARRADDAGRAARITEADRTARILVTGASGRIGRALVTRLAEQGERIRCLVRRTSAVLPAGVRRCVASLEQVDDVKRAAEGVDVIVHLGAAMSGDWAAHESATIEGTRHVVDAAIASNARLVYVSSLSVLALGTDSGFALDEDFPLESSPDERGHYSHAKRRAESIVRDAVRLRGLRAVIVRPGLVFGGALPLMSRAIASRVGGRWVVLGDGEQRLPLVYLDDVIDGIVAAVDSSLEAGEVVHLVDEEPVTQNEVLLRLLGDASAVVRVPRRLAITLAAVGEGLFGIAGRSFPSSRHRLRAAMTSHGYSAARARELLGWKPRVGVREGIERAVSD